MLWTTYILITFMDKCYGFQAYECDADIENSFGVWSQDHVKFGLPEFSFRGSSVDIMND
jgi:hypothetical protein